MAFTGIPREALAFYAELEQHNDREWWLAHKATYDAAVRQPTEELATELAAFGEAKVFRPYRDARFSHDKSPYKTHQGLFIQTNPRSGWYAQLDASGLKVGGGCYFMDGPQLAAYRRAVLAPAYGPELERVTTELAGFGYEIEGERLATRPRGIDADAPRMDLLRYKTLAAMMHLGTPDWLHTPDAAGWVADAFAEVAPLVEWLRDHVGAGDAAPRP